jgi:hypothetical protein
MIVPSFSTEFIWFCIGYGCCAMAGDVWKVIVSGYHYWKVSNEARKNK